MFHIVTDPVWDKGKAHLIVSFALILVLTICLCSSPSVFAGEKMEPMLNKGKKWRIGYYEGGPYVNYPLQLRSLIKGLSELGWIKQANIPDLKGIIASLPHTKSGRDMDPNNSIIIWEWLSRFIKSEYLQFSAEASWSAKWDPELRRKNRQEVLKVLKSNEIDLVIAMGTWAGQDLANNEHSVPTLVMSASDPVKAGIIKSPEDSGYNHVFAMCDPDRYRRQLRLFHSIVNFKKLGIVYEDTPEGRTYAAINDVQKAAKEKGFEVVSCEAPFSNVERSVARQAITKCHTDMASQVDAVYITVHRGVDVKHMEEIIRPLMEYKIPTFSQRGALEVKYGVLCSVDRRSFDDIGKYNAGVLAKIFNGIRPRDLKQVYEEPAKITLNMKTAREIGYRPPPDIIKDAAQIH